MEDRFGLVPPHIRANVEREEMVDRQLGQAIALTKALRQEDRRLDLVLANDRAEPRHGLMPGRWHVVRRNDPPEAHSYFPITTPDGGYRAPDFGVLEEMRKRDMWRHGRPDVTPEIAPERDKAHDLENAQHEIRAALRVAGDGGLTKRKWAKA